MISYGKRLVNYVVYGKQGWRAFPNSENSYTRVFWIRKRPQGRSDTKLRSTWPFSDEENRFRQVAGSDEYFPGWPDRSPDANLQDPPCITMKCVEKVWLTC